MLSRAGEARWSKSERRQPGHFSTRTRSRNVSARPETPKAGNDRRDDSAQARAARAVKYQQRQRSTARARPAKQGASNDGILAIISRPAKKPRRDGGKTTRARTSITAIEATRAITSNHSKSLENGYGIVAKEESFRSSKSASKSGQHRQNMSSFASLGREFHSRYIRIVPRASRRQQPTSPKTLISDPNTHLL